MRRCLAGAGDFGYRGSLRLDRQGCWRNHYRTMKPMCHGIRETQASRDFSGTLAVYKTGPTREDLEVAKDTLSNLEQIG